MRHVPAWFDNYPKGRRPSFPRLRGTEATRVVIVGGGLTGAACAHSLAIAGIPTVVLEAGVCGAGLTGGSAGVLREGFAGAFRDVVGAHGLRTARTLWDGLRRAGLDFAAAMRRYKVRGDLEARTLVTVASRGREGAAALRRDYDVRHDAGIEGSWLTAAALGRETALDLGGAIRTHGFTLDPYRTCIGMLRLAIERGAAVHEHSPVRRIRHTRAGVEVVTESGTLTADWVIITTGAPIQDLRPLRRHLRAEHVYGVLTEPVPGPMRRGMGTREAVLEDASGDHRYVRWMRDDSILIVGGRQPEVPERGREKALVQRTGQLMYELLLLYPDIAGLQPRSAWDAVDYDTADGLPFIGPHRNFPRHFFALASSRHGEGISWLAARMALRHITGEAARGEEAFGFPRIL